jgi:choline dehydrogenase-like flavoprotein
MGVVVKTPKINAKEKFTTKQEQLDAECHSMALETPPLHLGIFGLLLPWSSGLQFKLISMLYPHYGLFVGISRDHNYENNRVTIDSQGNPIIHYKLSPFDEKQLVQGLVKQLEILYSMNPSCLFVGHSKNLWFNCQDKTISAEQKVVLFKEYLSSIEKEGIVTNKITIYSAHQMSSCRMSATAEEGPTSATGELYECENMFLADGSVLPTSLGVNPMITIEAMSHLISKHVIAKLNSMK